MFRRELMNLTYAVNDENMVRAEDYAREFLETFNKKVNVENASDKVKDLFTLCQYAIEKGHATKNWWYDNEYTKMLYLCYMRYCGVI